jgi:hypothetical protein
MMDRDYATRAALSSSITLGEAGSEELMHRPQPAALVEQRVAEVPGLDAAVAGNVLGHLLQPPALLVGEAACPLSRALSREGSGGGFLLCEPRLEVGSDALRVGHQLVFLLHRAAHQWDGVGQDAPPVGSVSEPEA